MTKRKERKGDVDGKRRQVGLEKETRGKHEGNTRERVRNVRKMKEKKRGKQM